MVDTVTVVIYRRVI